MTNYEYHPSKTHRYFIADPGNGDTFFFATEAERDAFAADLIKDCLDVDGCYEESVEDIYVGEVTHLTARTNVTHRPSKEPDESVADYHERLEAEGWPDPDCDYTCSYELRPLNVKGETK